jgi:long-chain acyl-CoA synthetase
LKPEKSTALSPVCHFERMILYLHHYGVSIYFGESIEKISDNIKEAHQYISRSKLIEKYMIKSSKQN